MCGRYVIARAAPEMVSLFSIDMAEPDVPEPSYNIAPSQSVPIVLVRPDATEAARQLAPARWGLVPSYAASLTAGPTPFNARAEKLLDSPLYRVPFAKQRAIIPADGFYERRPSDKQSFYMHPTDGAMLAFAGIYQWWRPRGRAGDVPWLLTAAIVTRPAENQMATVHDREPLCLPPGLWDAWLDPANQDAGLLDAALAASGQVIDTLDFRTVGPGWLSTRPGQRLDEPGLIEPLS